jgi:VWFA-related protein
MFHKEHRYFFLLLIFFAGFMLFGSKVLACQEDKPLRYEIDVNALIVPIFAVDAKGKPVYDLKKEEITLLVNTEPVDIAAFTVFKVEGEKRVASESIEEDEGGQRLAQSEGSINFIIFDAISNSQKGLKRARKIALGIINESPSTDAFVILESDPKTGFHYVIGPETDKKKLESAIKEVVKLAGQRYFYPSQYFKDMGGNTVHAQGIGDISSWEYRARLFEIAIQKAKSDREDYQNDISTFLHSLSQMKYTLKTITRPKNVFLVSGGIPASSLGRELIRYYKFMSEAAKAINYGGSTLYLVDPVPPTDTSSSYSMKYMARVSGGKYFGGTNPEKIVYDVTNNTRAYYELAFLPKQSPEDKLRIELKCKRKGITLNTINYAEKGKPYKEMEELQKKLFALNVVTGGSWSRIVGDVKKAKYKSLKSTKESTNIHASKRIQILIPENMKNHNVDIFVVNLDPSTMKANFGIANQMVNQELEVDVPVEEEKVQFVVIVEPIKTLCLYNQVK